MSKPEFSKTVEVNGQQFELSVRWNDDRRQVKGRVYVWSDPDTKAQEEAIHAAAKAKGLQSGYTRRGEHPEIDRMWDAMNREIVAHKKAIASAAMAAVTEPSMSAAEMAKHLSFSRKAGCGCGCSPGFITDVLRRKDVFISPVKAAPEVDMSWVQLAEGK